MKTCAVPSCEKPRLDGSNFCDQHGPKPGYKAAAPKRGPTREPKTASAPGAQIVCPHCGVRGEVRTKQAKQKAGVSGGKATGAIMTGGLSLFATGLSRKQKVTQAHCGNCGVSWTIG